MNINAMNPQPRFREKMSQIQLKPSFLLRSLSPLPSPFISLFFPLLLPFLFPLGLLLLLLSLSISAQVSLLLRSLSCCVPCPFCHTPPPHPLLLLLPHWPLLLPSPPLHL